MIRVVVANGNMCRIFHYERSEGRLSLIKALEHPKGKLKTKDLVTDKQGHYKTRTHTRGSYAPHIDPKTHEIEHFTQRVAKELEQGRTANQYEKLILISPSQIDGMLINHLTDQAQRLIIANIKKDYMHMPELELTRFLRDNWMDIIH